MLRITKSKNAAGAAKYFEEGLTRGDYYATKEHSSGMWGGLAAKRLGLSGEVSKEDFVALCNNQKPDGSKLNPRHSDGRKVGWDFTFSVPKSVSLAYAVTGDERIKEAFEQSVEETMQEIQQNARTLIGQGKDKIAAHTSEMVYAGFTHLTSRPVDGVPDPHLHRHVFVMNSTWNKHQERFQAMEIRPIHEQAPYYQAGFHARVAQKLNTLGYGIAHKTDKKGRLNWELEGLSYPTLKKFSRRTSLIEKIAAEQQAKNGPLTTEQKSHLGAVTREKKQIGHSYQSLREMWIERLSESESDAIMNARRMDDSEKKKGVTAQEALQRATNHLFERKSAVKEYQLEAEALQRGTGYLLPEDIKGAIAEGDFHRKQIGETIYITTEEAVREEHKLLSYVRQGRGSQIPIHPSYSPENPILNDEQKAAVRHALSDTNNVTIIAGGAGTGKTTLMKEVAAGMKDTGKAFFGFAPSAAASRGVMRSEGFEQADTLAQLLVNPKLQEQTKGGVIWVDEAGLMGVKEMNSLFKIAREQKARILLTGDIRQHSSVTAGDALRLLEEEGGIKVARVSKIQRQRENLSYKRAVRMTSESQVDKALHQLDQMGWIKEIKKARHRLTMLVTDYTDTVKAGNTALIVSPTHIEGKSVTDTLREQLKINGVIDSDERTFTQLKNSNWTQEQKYDTHNYSGFDSRLAIEFHQNAKGYKRGDRLTVEGSKGESLSVKTGHKAGLVPLALSERFSVYQEEKIALAKGDKIRITKGGKTREGIRINNGDIFTIKEFTEAGHIQLHTGRTLDKSFGHISHGYVTTSHSSQGKTVDHVLIAQSSQSMAAANQKQFYVSISRGRHKCSLYTDNKKTLEQSVMQDGKRMSAREIANQTRLKLANSQIKKTKDKASSKAQRHGTSQSI